ncbi:MAG TPA: VanZ family protein [Candidatus Acidoferrales bacterium]|nr:VanZ family protein [Candidatus Acidoferrales bacterium]
MVSKLAWYRLQAAAGICVLAGILVATLYPFNPHPPNHVTWLAASAGLHFGGHGIVLSTSAFPPPSPAAAPSCSIELRAQADSSVASGPLVAFDSPGQFARFSIMQRRRKIVLERKLRTGLGEEPFTSMEVDAFRASGPLLITVTENPQATAVFINGVLAAKSARLDPFCADLGGWLALGNSPISSFTWRGTLLGLAIFGRELSAAEVLEDFRSWETIGRPSPASNRELRALYLFDERTGGVVHNRAGNAPDLEIPSRYLVPFKPFLEAPWKEFRPTLDYLFDIAVNIAGFMPFGFLCCSYFATVRRLGRAQSLTILLGFLLTFTIETLQGFLPTRGSGVTDIITNTTGTILGTMVFRWRPVQSFCSRLGIPG